MTLKDQMNDDVSVFLNTEEFAKTVTYNGAEIKAVVVLEVDRDKGNTFSNRGQSARAVISVACADVVSPQQGDRIIGDYDWQVARILETDEAMHKLECIANESPFG